LNDSEKNKGVVAVSGGNFAQGVAYAASQLGIQAIICMPAYTPSNYVEATKSYGAKVELLPDFPSTFAKAESFKADGKMNLAKHKILHVDDGILREAVIWSR